MKRALVSIALVACSLPGAGDYRDPGVGTLGLAGVEQCKQLPDLPCGWVYHCDADVEYCLPWADRAEIPKLKEALESLYGRCELSADPRFSGVPLCRYQCPSAKGCNAYQGCFCLEETP